MKRLYVKAYRYNLSVPQVLEFLGIDYRENNHRVIYHVSDRKIGFSCFFIEITEKDAMVAVLSGRAVMGNGHLLEVNEEELRKFKPSAPDIQVINEKRTRKTQS